MIADEGCQGARRASLLLHPLHQFLPSVLFPLPCRFGDIADEGCQEEVEYYRKMRARSFK